jgi:hypothetical protein
VETWQRTNSGGHHAHFRHTHNYAYAAVDLSDAYALNDQKWSSALDF